MTIRKFVNYEIKIDHHNRYEDLELLNVGDNFLYYELINMDLLKFSTDINLPKEGIPVNDFSNMKLRVYCKNFCLDIKLGYSLKIKICDDFENKEDVIPNWNITIMNKNIFLTQIQEILLNENYPCFLVYRDEDLVSIQYIRQNPNRKIFKWKREINNQNIVEYYYNGTGIYDGVNFEYYREPKKMLYKSRLEL
jgi:hypothetical protein